jgi:zinc transport system ATP-binding protein
MPLAINEQMLRPPIIVLNNLSFAYQNHPVLTKVCLEIYRGEFVGVIGPNGGGKTTLLKLIMGFLKPTQGSREIFGDTTSLSHSQSFPRLAYVPQTPRFDKAFPITVEEVVSSGLLSELPWYGRFRSRDKQTCQEALDVVGLADLCYAPFGTLSGGQAQRVLIARALVSHPEILLLDEPTASVDQQAEADIYGVLKKLKGQMTILMVTHDLQVAIDQVERVLCVQGHVFSLKPEEVCHHFSLGLYHTPLIPSVPT